MTLQIVVSSLMIVIDDTSLGSSITIVSSFIIQAYVITIINYNRKTFIVQATGAYPKLEQMKDASLEYSNIRLGLMGFSGTNSQDYYKNL